MSDAHATMISALERARAACAAERIAVELATDALVEIRELLLSEVRENSIASLELFADLETVRERVENIENALQAQRRLERLRAREAAERAKASAADARVKKASSWCLIL